jgi:hypothetical protein
MAEAISPTNSLNRLKKLHRFNIKIVKLIIFFYSI